MAVSMVRCSPVNGPITTDKDHRKYLATLPCAAAINPFPVLRNEDDICHASSYWTNLKTITSELITKEILVLVIPNISMFF